MRANSKYLFLLGLIVTSSVAARGADPFYAGEMYRAPSLDGMTGLLTMNIPYTMGPGLTVIGGVSLADSTTEGIAALRVGLSDNVEIGLKSKTYSVKPVTGSKSTGLGDAEAMIKWKFREQNENLPAMALAIGVILPTGSESKGFREVDKLGIKFGVTGATELAVFDDGYLGLYVEGQVIAIDKMTNSSPYKDTYGVVNIGIAFPISDNNRLSFFTEYNKVLSKEIVTIESNHSAVTPGLRFAHQNLSVTVAGQIINYENSGATQSRLIGQLSLGF